MHSEHRSLLFYFIIILFVYFISAHHAFSTSIKSLDLSYTGTIITNRNNFGPYHEAGISATISTRETPLIVQLNGQYRSYPDTSLADIQAKLDIWPKLWKYFYANVTMAYSPEILTSPLYPDYQFLSEFYFTGINNNELSLGAKISFYQHTNPLSLTASWSIIKDVNTFQTRIFCIPFNSGVELSGNILYRHTFIIDKLTIGAGAGGGTASSDDLDNYQYRHLLLINAKLYGKFSFSENSTITLTPVYSYEEYVPEKFTSKIDVQLFFTFGFQK
jgi:YaiO family outer membrane protein